MKLKITTLIENNKDDKQQLINEHGLSLYIEAGELRILFDTGMTGDFIKNAKVLKKDMNKLDYIIMSHGHYDHSGGFKKLIETINECPEVIVGQEFFNKKYKKIEQEEYKYNGNAFDEKFIVEHKIPIKKVDQDILHITDDIMLFHHFKTSNDFEKRNERFYIIEENVKIHDDFDDEIALGIVTSKGLVVIVGCSHVGIVNILSSISEHIKMPIYAVIGGTHLVEADESRIQKTVDAIRKMNIKIIAVSHCTGEDGIKKIKDEFKDEFIYNNTGNVISFDD